MSPATNRPGRAAHTYATTPYPGEIPTWSYCLDAGTVHRLTAHSADYVRDDGQSLTDWLSTRGHAYVPLVVYGSNACPGRLTQKFGPAANGFVALQATLHGAVRVWSARPSSQGSVPLTIADAPGQHDTAHLMLVPAAQAATMDRSEGRGGPYYTLARLENCHLELSNGITWPRPIAYVGHANRGPLLQHGRPVRYPHTSQDAALQLVATSSPDTNAGDTFLPPMTVIDPAVALPDAVDDIDDQPLAAWLYAHV